MARFAIAQNHLYVVDEWQMYVLDIANRFSPVQGNTVPLSWGIETIFPYRDNLFLGAVDGMHIFDVSNPGSPSFLSTYRHINSCDPVVVQDDLAYVTLRSGTECDGFTNQLDIVNISDLTNPSLEITYPMINPHGLGIDGGDLFICEGTSGLKHFNAQDIYNLDLQEHFEGFHALDVIPFNNLLMLIGEDGFYQYSYANGELNLLSHIPVRNEAL